MTEIKDRADEGEGLEDVVRAVCAVEHRLDEVARARIAARLAHGLDVRAVASARRQARGSRFATTALRWLLPSAAAALAAWFVVAHDLGRRADRPPFAATTSGSLDRLEVPAGERVRARLGRADLTVVGPAEMEVTRAGTSDMTLRLSSGVLVGDYDGRSGGRLRVETPRLVATIVGTRFAVEATTEHARVSVAHGRVAVRDAATPEGGPETFVNGGQTWEVGSSRTIATPAPVARLLAGEASPVASLAVETDPPRVPARLDRASAIAPRLGGRPAAPAALEAAPEPTVAVTTETQAPVVTASADSAAGRAGRASTGGSAPALQPPPLAVPPGRPAPAASPAELYRRAEEAMSERDASAARRWLEEIVARYPHEFESESARFELARDALDAHEPIRAGRWIDELIAQGRDRSLVESARFLKCRLAGQAGEASEARACLQRFRSDHPGSARDEEALAALVRLADDRGACDELRPLVAEHRRLYPGIVLPEGNRARCPP
jgi:ferric-dicitrate binding protein FerR (iron transport regulator)